MTAAPLFDTHAWVWWLHRDDRVRKALVAELDSLPVDNRPYVCDISLWEVAMLTARGRLGLTQPLAEWLEAASHPRVVRVVAISAAIAAEAAGLASSALRDPADRIIVATSRIMGVPLLTWDRAILRSRLTKRWARKS